MGLPGRKARRAILEIHIQKYGRKLENFTEELDELVSASELFSGAELEEAVISGLYVAFHHNRELKSNDILKAIKNINPLAKARKNELAAMVKWAQENAVNASHEEATAPETSGGRQLDL